MCTVSDDEKSHKFFLRRAKDKECRAEEELKCRRKYLTKTFQEGTLDKALKIQTAGMTCRKVQKSADTCRENIRDRKAAKLQDPKAGVC